MAALNQWTYFKKDWLHSTTVFLFLLLSLKIICTLFTLFIYAKISPFPDAERYLSAPLRMWDSSLLFNRTLFTDFFYAYLKFVLGNNILVHLFISTLLACVLWYILKSEYHYINKRLLIACLCLPHFLIWTGIVGKEALAIAGFLLIIKACVDLSVWNKWRVVPMLIGSIIVLIERPHYAMGYFYLFLISFITAKSKIKLMSLFSAKQSLCIFLAVMGYLALFLYFMDFLYAEPLFSFMMKTQKYFLFFTESATNRWNIVWQHPSDFFYNIPWGVLISLIGFTWAEVLSRPIMLPIFIEGCYSLLLFIILLYLLIRTIKMNKEYLSLLLWGFIPAVVFGLLINYPFGIFNAGSALRYKQSLMPLFYVYPLLMMSAIAKRNQERGY